MATKKRTTPRSATGKETLRREVLKSFAAFVGTLGESVETQAFIMRLFDSKDGLSLQVDTNKAKMKAYLASYRDTLEEADLLRYEKILASVEEACTPGQPSDF